MKNCSPIYSYEDLNNGVITETGFGRASVYSVAQIKEAEVTDASCRSPLIG